MLKLVSEFNRPPTHGMDEAARTASRGKNISLLTLRKIGDRLTEKGVSLRKMLDTRQGKELLNDLTRDGVIAENEITKYVNAKYNQLNANGKTLIEQTVLGSIIDDPDLLAVAPKSLVNKLGRSLSPLARLKARGGEWDITPNIKEAFELAIKATGAGKKNVDDFFQQKGLFGGVEYTPRSVRLAKVLLENTSLNIKKSLDEFASGAKIDTKGQGKFFAAPTADEMFEQSFGKVGDIPFVGVAEQRRLFGPNQKQFSGGSDDGSFRRDVHKDIPSHDQKGAGGVRQGRLQTIPRAGTDSDAAGVVGSRAVPVATGRVRRGPTHLSSSGDAVSLVRGARGSAQENLYSLSVDDNGKILSYQKHARGKKGSVRAGQAKPFDEAELNAIPQRKQKAKTTAAFGSVRRVSTHAGRGRDHAGTVLPPGGDDPLGLLNDRARTTVFVATGKIRRGPSHIKNVGEAASLVKDIRNFAQEKFYNIAVDENGKILNLHKYSKGTKRSTEINMIEAAGHAANVPGVKKVYTVHNHPGGTAKASLGDYVQAHRLDSVFKLADIDSEHLISAGNKYLNYSDVSRQSPPRPLKPISKEQRIFEKERHLKGPISTERRLDSESDVAQWGRVNHPNKAGFVIADNQNRPVGFFEYPKVSKLPVRQ